MFNFDYRYRWIFIESVMFKKILNLLCGLKMCISYIFKFDWLFMNNGIKLVKIGLYKIYINEKYYF